MGATSSRVRVCHCRISAIEVDLSQQFRRCRVTGRVIAQEKSTHDITRLTLQLTGDAVHGWPVAYVSIDGLDGVVP